MDTKIVKRYLHEDYEKSELEEDGPWPQGAPQYETYSGSLYELGLDLEVDLETGKSRVVAVEGIPLTKPGEFS